MIIVKNLVKRFGDITALDRVDFEVPKGAIFGLIGPNGAGKTTCLNILSTLIKPTSGEVTIDGIPIEDRPRDIRRRIGYMPDFFGICRSVTVYEYLDFYGGASGVPAKRRKKRIRDVLKDTNLTGKRDDLVDNLSRGMKQRLCLAKALVHNPRLLILDEPASGLDPRARTEIRAILRNVTGNDATVVISSHILSELDDLCTHIAIIEQGRILKCGTLAEVLEAARPRRTWLVRLRGRPGELVPALSKLDIVAEVGVREEALVIRLDENLLRRNGMRTDSLPETVMRLILESGMPIIAVNEDRANLEEAFLTLTQGLLA